MDQWAKREKLTPETLRVLKEEGFDTLEDMSELTSSDIDTLFTNLLQRQQCLCLKNAVERLNTESSQGQAMIKFLLVGKTGVGKSTTGNTILGAKKFTPSAGFTSETSKCEIHRGIVFGENVEVVDTPGLFDTSVKEDAIAWVIAQAITCMHPPPHIFLFLVKIGARFTQEQGDTYKRMVAIFDESVMKHMIVVFTAGDQIGPGNAIIDILDKAPPDLQNILKACENRYVVFNNRSTDRRQVRGLLDAARDLMQKNGNQSYSCPKYFFIEKRLKEEIHKRIETRVKEMESENKLQSKAKILEKEVMKIRQLSELQEKEHKKRLEALKAETEMKLCELEDEFPMKGKIDRTWEMVSDHYVDFKKTLRETNPSVFNDLKIRDFWKKSALLHLDAIPRYGKIGTSLTETEENPKDSFLDLDVFTRYGKIGKSLTERVEIPEISLPRLDATICHRFWKPHTKNKMHPLPALSDPDDFPYDWEYSESHTAIDKYQYSFFEAYMKKTPLSQKLRGKMQK